MSTITMSGSLFPLSLPLFFICLLLFSPSVPFYSSLFLYFSFSLPLVLSQTQILLPRPNFAPPRARTRHSHRRTHTPSIPSPLLLFVLLTFSSIFAHSSYSIIHALSSPSFTFAFHSYLSTSSIIRFPHKRHIRIMEPSIPIPSYPYPCLVHSTTTTPLSPTPPTTTLYLIGVATESIQKGKGRLELSSVDLTDINSPTIQLLESEVNPKHWTAFAPKLCAHYAGSTFPDKTGEVTSIRIHIQQFSKRWSFDSNALLEDDGGGKGGGKGGGNVKVKFETPKDWNKDVSLLSSKQFAIVGQAGESMYGVGMTDSPDLQVGTSWRVLTVDATADVDSYLYR